MQCGATLLCGGQRAAREEGEVQLTEYGLSGIPAMQLSCVWGALPRGGERAVSLDFFPAWETEALETELARRAAQWGAESLETLFLGLIHKRVLYAVMKDAGIGPLSRPGSTLKREEVRRLAAALKDWRLPVEGTLSWEQAQVTGGGVPLDEIDGSFASVRQPGLYLAGEILDATGTCGGYNLHWAWCSGRTAGRALDEIDGSFASVRQPGLYLAGEILDATGTCGGYNLHWAWCSGRTAGRAAAREVTA